MLKLLADAGMFGPFKEITETNDAWHGDGAVLPKIVIGAATIAPVEPGDFAPEPLPEPIPQSITMRQARLALLNAGLLDDVEAAIITMDEAQRAQTQIEWEYAQTVERDNALVAALGPKLGLDDAAIDSLFSMAATL